MNTENTWGPFSLERYQPTRKGEWDALVARSRNGAFLFFRDYMDYHSDRFVDHSLMFLRHGRPFALLPANAMPDGSWCSHRGLTYGGLVTDERATAEHVAQMMGMLNDYLRNAGFVRVVYKPTPWIYHVVPAEEDLHALFHVCHAQLSGRALSSAIDLRRQPPRFDESRRSGIRKAEREGIVIEESTDYEAFWNVLTGNLNNRYHAQPVHSLDEIRLLATRFPNNIRLFVARKDGEMLGGTVLYLSQRVVHTQYISATENGKQLGALDLLFHHLLHEHDFSQSYFDFGTSASDSHPSALQLPLLFQKEGFGARGICYDTYEWTL